MELRRCTRGIAALIVALGVLALVFDDPAAAGIAAALVVLLSYRHLAFLAEVRRTAASMTVTRAPENRLVRQGTGAGVATTVEFGEPPELDLAITDLPPAGTQVTGGNPGGRMARGGTGAITLRYTLTHLTSGKKPFEGVAVTFSDPFFRTRLIFSTDPYRKPEFTVFPVRAFEFERRDLYGEAEIDRATPVSGVSIRSFREFRDGDPLKQIDWKLTAKYRKRMIREYMGREGNAPLVIIDLPDQSVPHDAAALTAMKEKVASLLSGEMARSKEVSLAVISGANLVGVHLNEEKIGTVLAIVGDLAPADRADHLYRLRAPKGPGSHTRFAGPEPETSLARVLAALGSGFAGSTRTTRFERQMTTLLHATPSSDLHVFGLFHGDQSHMQLLAGIAKDLRLKTRLHVPPGARTDVRAFSFDGVEVFP